MAVIRYVNVTHIIKHGRKKSGKVHLRRFYFYLLCWKIFDRWRKTATCILLRVIVKRLWRTWRDRIGCQSFRTQVISYSGHFVPTLVIAYLLFGHFVPSNNHFIPRSFRTHFGHFVPRWTGYEMTIWWSIRTQVISYPFWSFRTQFGHIVPSKDGWMNGLTNGRKDRRVLIERSN